MVIPVRGLLDIRIFMNSSRTRSAEIIEMRSVMEFMADKTSGAISKSSWLAKRAARIMRSGSSEKDCSALLGVRSSFLLKSIRPLNGSRNSGFSEVNSSAIALTVKSRRDKSPLISFPYCTSGLRLCGS